MNTLWRIALIAIYPCFMVIMTLHAFWLALCVFARDVRDNAPLAHREFILHWKLGYEGSKRERARNTI